MPAKLKIYDKDLGVTLKIGEVVAVQPTNKIAYIGIDNTADNLLKSGQIPKALCMLSKSDLRNLVDACNEILREAK